MSACRPLLSSVLVSLAIATAGAGFQDVALRLQWTKGEVVRYRHTQESIVAMTGLPGVGEMNTTSRIVQYQQFVVDEVAADGAVTLRVSVESMKVDMSSPAGQMSFDSAAPGSANRDPFSAAFGPIASAIVGQPITLVVEPTGVVRSVSGATALAERIRASSPHMASAMNMNGGLNTFMSDEGLKAMMAQTLGNLPAGPVKVGDVWRQEMNLSIAPVAIKMSNTFTLAALETIDGRTVARIAVAQTTAPASGNMEGPAGQMTIQTGEGSGEGELVCDRQLGRLLRATHRSTMPMTMSMMGPDGQSLSVDSHVTTTVTIELVEGGTREGRQPR